MGLRDCTFRLRKTGSDSIGIESCLMTRALILLFSLLTSSVCLQAVERPEVGKHAPKSVVGTFVPGGWSEEQHSVCAVLAHRKEQKIAIFARNLNPNVMLLTAAMDKVVAENSTLKWSFLLVSHENSPTPSQEEWDAELLRLKQMTTDHKVEHLAAGLMIRLPDENQPSRALRKVGVFDEGDLVVMLIRPQAGANGIIQEVSVLQSNNLTNLDMDKVAKQMAAAARNQ